MEHDWIFIRTGTLNWMKRILFFCLIKYTIFLSFVIPFKPIESIPVYNGNETCGFLFVSVKRNGSTNKTLINIGNNWWSGKRCVNER